MPEMSFGILINTFARITLYVSLVLAVDMPVNPELNKQLKDLPNMLERLRILSDSDLLYDFCTNPMYSFGPGSVCNANAATWPILSTFSMTVAQLNLGPCAMLAPHIHRATNLVVAIYGSTHTYMFQENGARLVEQILTPGKMTIFPAASLHTMVNEGCDNNQLYSFLDSNDPGTLNFAQGFWTFGQDIDLQVMPMIDIEDGNWNATGQEIPVIGTGAQEGYQRCRKNCGLD